MPFIIYKATGPSGKCYIGFSSQTLEERKRKQYRGFTFEFITRGGLSQY